MFGIFLVLRRFDDDSCGSWQDPNVNSSSESENLKLVVSFFEPGVERVLELGRDCCSTGGCEPETAAVCGFGFS